MTIILNGTTGITTPDIDSTGGLDAADLTGALPAIDGSALTGVATAAQGALAATALQAASSLNSANLTGALPAIDGSALTGVGGSTTYGAVGTYLWANRGSSTSTISSNSTYAGSGLYPTGLKAFIYPAASASGGVGYHVSNGPNPAAIGSGTWRAMGQSGVGGNTSYSYLYPSTIFVRIS
jgi:hypothetical protein